MEYFAPSKKYKVLSPDPNTAVSTYGKLVRSDNYEPLSYHFIANAVTNAAVGFRWYINEKWHGISGFRTDFSNQLGIDYESEDALPNMDYINFNKFHLTSGTNLNVRQIDLILGLQYSWGREMNITTIRNFADPVEYSPETGKSLQGYPEDIMDFKFDEISLFFGFTYMFF